MPAILLHASTITRINGGSHGTAVAHYGRNTPLASNASKGKTHHSHSSSSSSETSPVSRNHWSYSSLKDFCDNGDGGDTFALLDATAFVLPQVVSWDAEEDASPNRACCCCTSAWASSEDKKATFKFVVVIKDGTAFCGTVS